MSPEALGYQLGVSGATVRRWETGRSTPSDEDLTRLADVCCLSPQQREFLHRLYGRHAFNYQGAPECFREEAIRLLSNGKPAYLVDELFYVRAWNSYFTDHMGPLKARLPEGINSAHIAFSPRSDPDDAVESMGRGYFARLTWMWTAHLGTTSQYTELMHELFKLDGFTDHLREIIDEMDEGCQEPLLLPVSERVLSGGRYHVSMSETVFPPVYRLVEYDPQDERAVEKVRQQAESGPPRIGFADRLHWSEH